MKWLIEFTVTGFGQFPIDMLRHDRCFPATESESGKIANSFYAHSGGMTWSVQLKMHGSTKATCPTVARWESFCCKVKDVEATKLSI
jgi:hypothetical protein